ncbi:Mix paired-like homeobox [Balamuthia mandrillaris]
MSIDKREMFGLHGAYNDSVDMDEGGFFCRDRPNSPPNPPGSSSTPRRADAGRSILPPLHAALASSSAFASSASSTTASTIPFGLPPLRVTFRKNPTMQQPTKSFQCCPTTAHTAYPSDKSPAMGKTLFPKPQLPTFQLQPPSLLPQSAFSSPCSSPTRPQPVTSSSRPASPLLTKVEIPITVDNEPKSSAPSSPCSSPCSSPSSPSFQFVPGLKEEQPTPPQKGEATTEVASILASLPFYVSLHQAYKQALEKEEARAKEEEERMKNGLHEGAGITKRPPRKKPSKTGRRRIKTTEAQKEVLEKIYETTKWPDKEMRAYLSEFLQMKPQRRVQVWFQNRRAAEKKEETVSLTTHHV